MRRVMAVLAIGLLASWAGAAEGDWVEDSFEEFRDGTFEAAG